MNYPSRSPLRLTVVIVPSCCWPCVLHHSLLGSLNPNHTFVKSPYSKHTLLAVVSVPSSLPLVSSDLYSTLPYVPNFLQWASIPMQLQGWLRLLVVPITPVLTTWTWVRSEESEGGTIVFRVSPHRPVLQGVNEATATLSFQLLASTASLHFEREKERLCLRSDCITRREGEQGVLSGGI